MLSNHAHLITKSRKCSFNGRRAVKELRAFLRLCGFCGIVCGLPVDFMVALCWKWRSRMVRVVRLLLASSRVHRPHKKGHIEQKTRPPPCPTAEACTGRLCHAQQSNLHKHTELHTCTPTRLNWLFLSASGVKVCKEFDLTLMWLITSPFLGAISRLEPIMLIKLPIILFFCSHHFSHYSSKYIVIIPQDLVVKTVVQAHAMIYVICTLNK